jgi:SAM-dependent methyltransferase
LATSPWTRGVYRSLFDWIDDYSAEVVARRGFDKLLPPLALQLAYELALSRSPDSVGAATYMPLLRDGSMSNRDLLQSLQGSSEGVAKPQYSERNVLFSLHTSRSRFVQALPRASDIVDLGGTDRRDPRGALLSIGYPYRFDSLVIVDLPSQERHPTYRGDEQSGTVNSDMGPVSYRYHSMVDLSGFDEGSVDLVYCGQSIEHVTAQEGAIVMKEVHRILRPGGHFALDTPNGRLTRLQQDEFIDPDHKVEYTWPQLSQMILDAGFAIEWAKGLNYGGEPATQARFEMAQVAANCGLFDAIDDCYLLAVVATKPHATAKHE